jgi:hypothetical protein
MGSSAMKKSTMIILALSAATVIGILAFGTQPARVGEACITDDLVYETKDGVVHFDENSSECSPANEGIAPVGEVVILEQPAASAETTYSMETAR